MAIVSAASSFFCSSGVILPCSWMLFSMAAFLSANSFLVLASSWILPITTSSSAPVLSLRYRAMKGMVAPSANNDNTASTCAGLMLSDEAMA